MNQAANAPEGSTSGPWLPGGEPGRSVISRANIRTRADIALIEQYSFDELLAADTIFQALENAAAIDPDKVAIKHLLTADLDQAPREITYREFIGGIKAAASLFQEISAGGRPAVGIILPMMPEALIAGWGASAVGVACQINPFLEMKYVVSILNSAGATVLITATDKYGPGAWSKLDEIVKQVPTLKRVLIVEGDDPSRDFGKALQAQAAKGAPFTPVTDPDAEATYLPTGGTTATPKLVPLTHRGQLVNAWIDGALGGSATANVVGHAMPNFHVGGLVVVALRTLIFGQTLLTLTTDGFRNPKVVSGFWDIARRHGMTSVLATPATAAALLAVPNASHVGHTIHTFHAGASTIPVALAHAFHEKFGIWLRELWGMTEVQGAVTGHPNDVAPVIGSVGIQMPHQPVRAFIVDETNTFVRECAPGERGVLAISGPGVMKGYVNSELNASFHIKGVPDGKRWGNTGDLGMIDKEGYVWIFGRAKDVIIRGGHNIDANLIEEVLVRHPAVQLAAAIGLPDAAKGELPIAFVQLKQGVAASTGELMELCRKDVQERAAIPVKLTILDQMPMTAVGKIAKPVLRKQVTAEVATQVARDVLGERPFEVSVDDARSRLLATVRISGKPDAAIENRLKEAFKTYEFNTAIEFA